MGALTGAVYRNLRELLKISICSSRLQLVQPKFYCNPSNRQQVYLIDEDEPNSNVIRSSNANKYTNRSYTCGELRSNNIGETVVLCGWLEFHRMNKFVVLRDSYGETQLLIRDTDTETQKLLSGIPYESIIQARGTVVSRPQEMFNDNQPTGEVEVLVDEFKVMNKAKSSMPFNIRQFQKAKESLRMQYRYLDLRFPQMQRNMRVRSTVLMKMREFLVNNNFVDVETPTLFKATPGGAQEFIVPTRFPGQFYSLVQSPQQFKQMLMAGAIDRYFQIARCYRDESTRSDRQPEFTQLDIELSFTDVDGVLRLVEEVIGYAWPDFLSPVPINFPRISYKDAMETYGSDKPDMQFGFELKSCTDLFKSNEALVTDEDFGAYFLLFPKECANLTAGLKEHNSRISFHFKKSRLLQYKVKSVNDWITKLGRVLGPTIASSFVEEHKIQDDSVVIMAYGNKNQTQSLLGTLRLEYVRFLESLGVTVRRKGMIFAWIVDFPLFEISQETGQMQSAHHPFTAPHPDDLHLLKEDPLKVRALAYDLVLNGHEIGGGSVRIHDPSLQKSVLDLLQIGHDTMPHFLDMLESGCPPHGGIALGLDRFLSILLGATSIRDVMAFPKNFEGRDPISGAPSPISDKEQKQYHIRTLDIDKHNS